MPRGARSKRPLDLTKPFFARGADPIYVTALDDSRFVFDLIPTGKKTKKKTVIVDKMGCNYNGGGQLIWNSDLELPRFKEGDTVCALRLSSNELPIIRGEVKAIEGKHFYVIRVPFEKNPNREDGYFKVAFSSVVATLAEAREKVNVLVEAIQKLERLEAITTEPVAVVEKVVSAPEKNTLKKGWMEEALMKQQARAADKSSRRVVRGMQ